MASSLSCLTWLMLVAFPFPGLAAVTPIGSYPHLAALEENDKYTVFWKHNDTHITFEIHAATQGVVGFGVSPGSDLPGSDIFFGSADDDSDSDSDENADRQDRHISTGSTLVVDTQQDWRVQHVEETATHTIFIVTRKLANCDPNPGHDLSIQAGTTRVIFTRGTSGSSSEENGENLVWHSKSMVLLNIPMPESLPSDVITIDILYQQDKIPGVRLPLMSKIIPLPQLTTKHHIVKMEPIIQSGNEDLVHYVVVDVCYGDINASYVNHLTSYYGDFWMWPIYAASCNSRMYAWTLGGGPLILPDHVGYPYGENGLMPKFARMQLYYDNPDLRSDIVDSSGVRLYLTPTLRPHDSGIFLTGVSSHEHWMAPRFDELLHRGYCRDTCLTEAFGSYSEINVFAISIHAHSSDVSAKLRHFRNGVELPPIANEPYYDYNFQPYHRLATEVKIKKGDNLMAECIYDTSQETNYKVHDHSDDEQCRMYLTYYPKVNLAQCRGAPTEKQVLSFAGNGEYVDGHFIVTEGPYAGKDIHGVLSAVDWTDQSNRDAFQQAIAGGEIENKCDKTHWIPLPQPSRTYQAPTITQPYVEPDQCGGQ